MDTVQKPSINECYTPSSEPYRVNVFILAIIIGQDPVGEQVYLHGKPHHTAERPLQEPPERLQCLQQF
jgi:hypothetical protein